MPCSVCLLSGASSHIPSNRPTYDVPELVVLSGEQATGGTGVYMNVWGSLLFPLDSTHKRTDIGSVMSVLW